ncbi:MAG: AAA family ATPase [Pseudoflavonifractor sp.]|nr:AAA family ATPase [Pseudoflavonifractor sp.]
MSKNDSDRALPDVSDVLVYESRFLDPSLSTGLWFCEDAEAVQTVGVNAVSLALTAKWNDLCKCADFFKPFPYVLVVAADGGRRREMQEAIQTRLTYMPVLVAQPAAFKGCSSVAALRAECGPSAVEELLCGAVELPSYGLLNLAEVVEPDIWKLPRTFSGIRELDRSIGGFFPGELSVWTGNPGGGKSTLLGQILAQAIDQGHKVCAYSGELPAWKFKNWITLQAAGPDHIESRLDEETGKTIYSVGGMVRKQIDEWWDKRFFLYDLNIASAHDEDSILDTFTLAHRKYGCDIFLVDNIMTCSLKGAREADYYRAQSAFMGRLVNFAKRFGVHVHLVAHPRKTDGKKLTGDDIAGSKDLMNRSDNTFSVRRLDDDEAESKGYSTVLEVLKNRAFGTKPLLHLSFDAPSRRFFKAESGSPDWKFNWESVGKQVEFEELGEIKTPFEEERDG